MIIILYFYYFRASINPFDSDIECSGTPAVPPPKKKSGRPKSTSKAKPKKFECDSFTPSSSEPNRRHPAKTDSESESEEPARAPQPLASTSTRGASQSQKRKRKAAVLPDSDVSMLNFKKIFTFILFLHNRHTYLPSTF